MGGLESHKFFEPKRMPVSPSGKQLADPMRISFFRSSVENSGREAAGPIDFYIADTPRVSGDQLAS